MADPFYRSFLSSSTFHVSHFEQNEDEGIEMGLFVPMQNYLHQNRRWITQIRCSLDLAGHAAIIDDLCRRFGSLNLEDQAKDRFRRCLNSEMKRKKRTLAEIEADFELGRKRNEAKKCRVPLG